MSGLTQHPGRLRLWGFAGRCAVRPLLGVAVLWIGVAVLWIASLGTAFRACAQVTPTPDAAALEPVMTQSAAQGATPALHLNPVAAMRAFEPPIDDVYRLGRGDEISIDFSGRPELNAKRILGPDGKITLPLAGTFSLENKTREEAAELVSGQLAPYYQRLSVTVGVDRYNSNRVLLLGAVQTPGIITFSTPPTLLEVLAHGGGLRTATSNDAGGQSGGFGAGGSASLARSAAVVPQRLAIYRGESQVLWVDLKGLLDSGSPLANLRLKRDDVIYVPSPLERYISVLGQVSHPGAFNLDNNTTLPKLLALAGGTVPQAGGDPKIQIIQPETGVTRIIPLKTILSAAPLDLTLRSGDVIFVPESGFNKFSYSLDKLSPLVTLFTAFTLLNGR